MEVIEKQAGAHEFVPRHGGALLDRRLPVERIAEAVGAVLPKSEVRGKGADFAFGETALAIYGQLEEGSVRTLAVQLTKDASKAQRTAALDALLGLGALGLVLSTDDGDEIDLSDAAAVRRWLGA